MAQRTQPLKSIPRNAKNSYSQICKRLSLNVGLRTRLYKRQKGKLFGKLQAISRSQNRPIPNVQSPCVYDTRRAGTRYGGRPPFRMKFRFGNQNKLRHRMQRTYGIRTVRLLKRVYRATNCVWYGSEYFLVRLERRVSTMAWRAGFVQSMTESRRWATNGYWSVDGVPTHSAGFLVNVGGIVSVSVSIWHPMYRRRFRQLRRGFFTNPAPWLSVDYMALTSRYVEEARPECMTFSHPIETGRIETRFTAGRNAGLRSGPSQ